MCVAIGKLPVDGWVTLDAVLWRKYMRVRQPRKRSLRPIPNVPANDRFSAVGGRPALGVRGGIASGFYCAFAWRPRTKSKGC